MPTPAIQTLVTDAQQVLNLSSISAVRATVAVALANANTGTPLNPNLTTQQLWDQFYQVVTQPKSDIESIIANQLMKFLYAPPAPGGVGADKQVIFNDGGTLAGDADFIWNKTTNLLTVTGSATITGDLTVDTSTLKVDSTNNRVGIGTASPGVTFDVAGPIRSIVSGGTPFFYLNNGTSQHSISNTSNNMVFNVYASDKMTLDSSGNLGLGVTPAAAVVNNRKLEIAGDINSAVVLGSKSANASARNWATASNWNAYGDLVFLQSNAVGGDPLAAGTTRMTLNSNGALVLQGGTAAANGVGIAFPATQSASSDANTLDDYEEGSWTGTLTGGTTNPTTPVTATGRYTKIGRVVTVQISFSNVNTTGASGLIGITGLPFANNGSVGTNGSVSLYLIATFTGSPFASIGVNESFINLYANNSGGAFTDVTHNAGASKYLTASVTYTVA